MSVFIYIYKHKDVSTHQTQAFLFLGSTLCPCHTQHMCVFVRQEKSITIIY